MSEGKGMEKLRMRLDGVLAPICTPFLPNGDVASEALRQNLEKYNESGLTGYVVCGSTGESALLSKEEKLAVFETVAGCAHGRTLVAGTGAESVRETVCLVNTAATMGYQAALILTPHYYRAQMLRPESQLAYFRAVADGAQIPILIYNFPQNTALDLPLDVVQRLAEHGNIAGVKESSADLAKIASLTEGLPPTFKVLVGASAKFHASLCVGAAGGILAIANASPKSTQAIFDRYRSGDVTASKTAQEELVEPAGVAPKYGIQGLKYAMDLKGYYGGECRLPLIPLTAGQKAEIETLFKDVGA